MAAVTPLCNSNQDEKSSRSHTVYYNEPCEMQHKISWSTVRRCDCYSPQPALNKGPCLMTLCAPVFWLKRFQIFCFCGNINLPAPPPYQKPHFPCFRLPFQVETFTPCLQRRRLLAGDPPSHCSASPIQAGNPHRTPILLLLPHPTCPDRRRERDTFHPNHRPLHQISAGLSHGARSIARTGRSIWQQRSKSRPHA